MWKPSLALPSILYRDTCTAPEGKREGTAAPQADALRRQKLERLFMDLETAENRRADPHKTVKFIQMREAVMGMPKTPALARALHQLPGIRMESSRTARLDGLVDAYAEGPLGREAGLKQERRKWRTPANVEFVHTVLGRMLALVTGTAFDGVLAASEKALLAQTVGHGGALATTGVGRIATDIAQTWLDKAGKPALPGGVQRAASLDELRADLTSDKKNHQKHAPALADALAEFHRDPTADNLARLQARLEQVEADIADSDDHDRQYKESWASFKRQYLGRRLGSAASMGSGAAGAAIAGAGLAAAPFVTAASVPLQWRFGVADFMKEKDYRLRTAAKRIDIGMLLKEGSRGKPVSEIGPEDIDTRCATRLWESHPQAVMDVTREIYRHKLAELVYERRRLAEKFETRRAGARASRLAALPAWLSSPAADRERLERLDQKIATLKKQIGHFERREIHAIDPNGTIGRALTDPGYFFRKGTAARCNNKVGELWVQIFQRIGPNFQLPSAPGGRDAVSRVTRRHKEGRDGQDEWDGETPSECAGDIFGAYLQGALSGGVEEAMAKLASLPVPATQGTPAQGCGDMRAHPGTTSAAPEKEAMKDPTKAPMSLHAIWQQQQQRHRMNKIRSKDEARATTPDRLHADWVVEDILGKDGKPIIIDLRESGACYRENVRLEQRMWRVLRAIPPAMLSTPLLAQNALKTRIARRRARKAVAEAKQLAAEADAVIAAADTGQQVTVPVDETRVRCTPVEPFGPPCHSLSI